MPLQQRNQLEFGGRVPLQQRNQLEFGGRVPESKAWSVAHQQHHYHEYFDLGWCEHGPCMLAQFSSRWHLGAQESPCRHTPPHLSEDSPVMPLKQFQCWFD